MCEGTDRGTVGCALGGRTNEFPDVRLKRNFKVCMHLIAFDWTLPTFWSSARALQTRFDCWAVSVGGVIDG